MKKFFTALTLIPPLLLTACSPVPEPSDALEVAARTVQSGALSRDGNWAVIGSVYHGGGYWHLPGAERLFNWNHSDALGTLMLAADISPDGGWAATVDEQSLVLWSTETGSSRGFWRLAAGVNDLALGRHGNVALLGMVDGRAAFYNVRGGGVYQSFEHQGEVNSVAVNDDLSLALTGGEDFAARLWDSQTGELIFEKIYREPVQRVALTADGSRAFVAAQYDRVEIIDVASQKVLWQLPLSKEKMLRGLSVTVARFSQDGQYLLTGRPDGRVQLWDIDGQEEVYTWQLPKRKAWQPTANAVMDLSFTEHGDQYKAIGSNGFVYTLSY
ncbi:WD40 repeat domain-containing protein [Gilvimarinus sp. 1_MG-2023]|uniref:WD40 repeat domain-containing protein n=1 Tax=Gilvimarinus sp. 1_MG-2023 TaxID=3062638 RepID=UPI0026E445AA|nr:WD40 repeat domain-containing protein [Gilvimarinus sp. 1_MG-2023]MDO6747976.1 WD40 repeat domain-containing protein [Gilvimarinus sp. 1_MG-2023]